MSSPSQYSFTRYLSAKKSVDDRALNKDVWQALKSVVPAGVPTSPLHILEVGAGIGTMIERLLDWSHFQHAHYTALDEQDENTELIPGRLSAWADRNQAVFAPRPSGEVQLESVDRLFRVFPHPADVFDFVPSQDDPHWDLLIANAFLDLVHIPSALAHLFRLLRPGGWFYLTLNFDGLTLFEPAIDPALDELITLLYHRTMDERLSRGLSCAGSRSGRQLFEDIRQAGGQVLASGASDWVVFAGPSGYPHDEAYFLHFIIHTLERALQGHPELDAKALSRWANARHLQVERCELVYIAHQLDFFGRFGYMKEPIQMEEQ
jgi:SAM-dependent methyltransferase